MNIFFLLPFLLVGVPIAYGETLSSFTVYEGVNPDGTTFETLNDPLIFDGNNYVPFIYQDNMVYTSHGNIRANADGSFTWTNKNITDTIVVKYADISNLNSWTYPNTLNSDVPDISWDGSKFVTEKNKAGIGNVKYRYIDYNGVWKTELEATNLSSLTTKVFGFDEYFDIPTDTIRFGGQIRNLDNFDGHTFDRTFLVNNQAKVIDILNGIQYDFDIAFPYLHSVTVIDTGVDSTRLIFDYRMDEVLLPGETIVLDPTVTQTTGGSQINMFGASFFAVGEKMETASAQLIGATLDSLDVWIRSSGSPSGDMTGRIYNDAGVLQETSTNTINANTLTGSFAQKSFTFAGTHTLVEGDRIVAHYSGGDGGNFAQVEASPTDVYDSTDSILTRFSSGAWDDSLTDWDLKFIIVYSLLPPPDPIDDLTYDNLGTNSLDLLWTEPALNGGTLQGYTVNYTSPWGTPTTFLANTTNTYYNVTGLTFGTDYSFRVSAITQEGGNTTGATIVDVTTTSNSYATPPTNLVATAESATQIDLDWTAPSMQNINGYRIQRETPIGTGWTTIVSNTTNTNNWYNNTGLSTNVIYNYRVYAMNGTGVSTASNTYAMTTFHLPDAVTDLTGSATDLSTINLSWTAPASYAPEIEGYMINGTTPTGEPVDILNSNTGTTATTATALNLLIGQEYSFRVSPITVHGMNTSGNIWNGSTVQTFVIGDLSNPDITNDDDFSIFFDRTDINSSAIQLDVTYPNSYDLSCDFDYKYARTNQTYSGLTSVPDGADDQTATFILINATGDLVQVRCWDPATGDESIYIITITDFPFLEQVNALRSGEYGTFFQIGAFDGVMLIVIFIGMIGLNRTTPIVGIVFVVITTLALSYFGLITYPVIMYPALIMMIVWAFVTTRKDD